LAGCQAFNKDFTLLYLFMDTFGPAGEEHRRELRAFCTYLRDDVIDFRSLSYQEAILHLSVFERAHHASYVEYLTARYL
jgi:hypothetical protein